MWAALYMGVLIVIVLYLVLGTPYGQQREAIPTRVRHVADEGSDPLFSPDGGAIAFAGGGTYLRYHGRVMSVTVGSTTTEKRVWLTPASGGANYELVRADHPVYSWVEGAAGWRLVVAGVDNQQKRAVVSASWDAQGCQTRSIPTRDDLVSASYSPTGSGRIILCGAQPTYKTGLLSYDEAGPEEANLKIGSGTRESDADVRPVWSPDGRFAAWVDAGSRLTVCEPAANRTTTYGPGGRFSGYFGRHISWHPTKPILVHEIWSQDPFAASVSPSPGMTASTVSAQSCVGVGWLNAETGDGGTLYRSGSGGDCISPVWHPWGEFVACMTTADQPFLIDARSLGRNPQPRLRTWRTRPADVGDRYPVPWQGCDLGSWLSWSPDGARLAYGRTNGGIVIFEFDLPGHTFHDLWR
jgi:hypothetical protein